MKAFLPANGNEDYGNHISDEENEVSQFAHTFPLSLLMSLYIKLGSFTGRINCLTEFLLPSFGNANFTL